ITGRLLTEVPQSLAATGSVTLGLKLLATFARATSLFTRPADGGGRIGDAGDRFEGVVQRWSLKPSGITSKPASRDHLKTGQL
ncbi:MAG TPA: hypothetical protein VFL34_02685, partial [Candidatus Sulfotelmatobacter sp.]|nr:hypothetical protein [Candidatus Sulfotelmatobacter sp.]